MRQRWRAFLEGLGCPTCSPRPVDWPRRRSWLRLAFFTEWKQWNVLCQVCGRSAPAAPVAAAGGRGLRLAASREAAQVSTNPVRSLCWSYAACPEMIEVPLRNVQALKPCHFRKLKDLAGAAAAGSGPLAAGSSAAPRLATLPLRHKAFTQSAYLSLLCKKPRKGPTEPQFTPKHLLRAVSG